MRNYPQFMINGLLLSCLSVNLYAADASSASQQVQLLNSQIQVQLQEMQQVQQKQVIELNTKLQAQLLKMQTTLEQQMQTMNQDLQAKMKTMQDNLTQQMQQLAGDKKKQP